MQSNTKEWIQYSTAIIMITSGIILAFLSFFLNKYDIADGVLWFIAQALVYAGSIFGVGMYFHTKLGDFESKATQAKSDIINTVMDILKSNKDEDNPEKDK